MKYLFSFSKKRFGLGLFLSLLLFLTANSLQAQVGIVKSHQKISATEGNFTGTLEYRDLFGSAVASLGDLDGDGVNDLAVGAREDDDGFNDSGAVWILFMNTDGSVKSHQKISAEEGNLGPNHPYRGARFGHAVAALGDVNGDGIPDLAVSGGVNGGGRGHLWILFLEKDGTVKGHQGIGSGQGNFKGKIEGGDQFGFSLAALGDMNSDGTPDLVVGAIGDHVGYKKDGSIMVSVFELRWNGQVSSKT